MESDSRRFASRHRALIWIVLLLVVLSAGLCWTLIGKNSVDADLPTGVEVTTYRIMDGEVIVDATVTGAIEEGGPPYAYEFEIHVKKGADDHKTGTFITGAASLTDAIDEIKKETVWRDRYLFVVSSCGSGNAWRCAVENVYKIENDRLIYLGDTGVGGYKDGLFYDVYDGIQVNDLTARAYAPVIRIVLNEQKGKLVVNLEKTWAENRKVYLENESIIGGIASDDDAVIYDKEGDSLSGSEEDHDKLFSLSFKSALLFNAALSGYCDKQEEYSKYLDIAARKLKPELNQLFVKTVSSVKPGELP